LEEIQRPLEVIEKEITELRVQFKENVERYVKLSLGENATKQQIANYAASMFGIDSDLTLTLITGLKVIK
jgi:hypothetical protein